MPKLSILRADSMVLPPDLSDPEVQVWRDPSGRVFGYSHIATGRCWIHLLELASFGFDRSSGEVMALGQPHAQPDQIQEAYRRIVLPMVTQVRGHEVLHASAVRMPHGVVAMCGVSGTGKSTIAYALSRWGYPVWADDAVTFDTSGPGVRGIPLPFSLRLLPDAALFFAHPSMTSHAPSAGAEFETEPAPAPLAAVCLLKRETHVRKRTTVNARRFSPAFAFSPVLEHAYVFSVRDMERKRLMIQHYLDLAKRVPVFEVCFQAGLESLPAIVDSIVQAVKGH